MVKFKPIPFNPLPNVDENVLSQDQQMLYKWTNAIMTGFVPGDLVSRTAATVHNARFMNHATNMLRLYASQTNPSHELSKIVEFCIKVHFSFKLPFFKLLSINFIII